MTRLPSRTMTATDLVAASTGVVRCRCRSFLLFLIAAVTSITVVDSGRRRLVLLSVPWRVSARELFRGVGFLGERAARDAIVLPLPVPTADCVPAHTTVSRKRGPPGRVLSVVAQCRDVVTRQALSARILSLDRIR